MDLFTLYYINNGLTYGEYLRACVLADKEPVDIEEYNDYAD